MLFHADVLTSFNGLEIDGEIPAYDSVSVIDANPSVRARTEAVLTVEMYLSGD
jgi:hypothetical protein